MSSEETRSQHILVGNSMARIKRSSDVKEVHGEYAFVYGIIGLLAIVGGGILMYYRGDGVLIGFSIVAIAAGGCGIFYSGYQMTRVKKVPEVHVICPYCAFSNALVSAPVDDFACTGCNRLIPLVDGAIVPVHQVRCGFCNALNYYSEKTEVLLCEECNREVPIAQADDMRPQRHSRFAVVDDEKTYELILSGYSPHKVEELMEALQHMLALNRTQVKQMLEDLPVPLLTGINRRKAEMLHAQLSVHDAEAEYRALN